jgi:hypothetical protein
MASNRKIYEQRFASDNDQIFHRMSLFRSLGRKLILFLSLFIDAEQQLLDRLAHVPQRGKTDLFA